jgi:hypothetical protein
MPTERPSTKPTFLSNTKQRPVGPLPSISRNRYHSPTSKPWGTRTTPAMESAWQRTVPSWDVKTSNQIRFHVPTKRSATDMLRPSITLHLNGRKLRRTPRTNNRSISSPMVSCLSTELKWMDAHKRAASDHGPSRPALWKKRAEMRRLARKLPPGLPIKP